MAHLVPGILAAVFAGALNLFFVRAAWLHWTGSGRAPDLYLGYSWNPSVVEGHERGIVPFTAAGVCMTIGIAVTAASDGEIAMVNAGVILILCSPPLLVLHLAIAWFNWPKVLVPPHRRGETGSVIEWWRGRGQRAPRDKGHGRGGG
ncbi:hypothetical protein ACFY78_18325 [Streptomyces olindensis]|uniref:hypothetical protein n=1 Tax=Streptomyces olindensis TaxID=358823 RepID=UPI0036798964